MDYRVLEGPKSLGKRTGWQRSAKPQAWGAGNERSEQEIFLGRRKCCLTIPGSGSYLHIQRKSPAYVRSPMQAPGKVPFGVLSPGLVSLLLG